MFVSVQAIAGWMFCKGAGESLAMIGWNRATTDGLQYSKSISAISLSMICSHLHGRLYSRPGGHHENGQVFNRRGFC